MSEHILQVNCINWFRLKYPKQLIYAIPNGGFRHYSTAKRLKAEGVVSGIPDLFVPTPNEKHNGLYIELKFGYNKPSASQKKIMEYLSKNGYLCVVCWTIDQFIEAVDNYFWKLI